MTSQEKKILIQKYFQGQCSTAEKQQVQVFLQQADKDVELNQLLDEAWQNMKLYPDMNAGISATMYRAIASRIDLPEKTPADKANYILPALRPWRRMAAVIAMLIVFSGVAYRLFWHVPDVIRQTGYGQMATVTLPDKSVVMLNGNSRIRYKKQWNDHATREVWLEGEGFFKVVHRANHQKFVVHAADQVAVEVLGTTFSVAKRKMGTRVVLNEGKVRLNVGQAATPASVDLKPGDLVQVAPNAKKNSSRPYFLKKQIVVNK